MTKKVSVMRIVLSVATVLLLLLLAWNCLDIYLTGTSAGNLDENGLYIQNVYRADDVAKRLSSVLFWGVLYAVLVLTALSVLSKAAERKVLPDIEPDNMLRLLKKRTGALPEEALAQERYRKKVRLSALLAVVLCIVMCLRYLLDGSNFTSWELEVVMAKMLLHILPWVVLGFAIAFAATYACRRSIKTEAALIKASAEKKPADAAEKKDKTKKITTAKVQIALYLLAAVLIVLGIDNGGMRDVFIKAVNICTECIGLG